MANNKENKEFIPASINWVRRIYGKLPISIENTRFLIKIILHI